MSMGAWEEAGKDIMATGEEGVAKWAINHVIEYAETKCSYDYCGPKPLWGNYSYMSRYEETIAMYEEKYGEGFWKEEAEDV